MSLGTALLLYALLEFRRKWCLFSSIVTDLKICLSNALHVYLSTFIPNLSLLNSSVWCRSTACFSRWLSPSSGRMCFTLPRSALHKFYVFCILNNICNIFLFVQCTELATFNFFVYCNIVRNTLQCCILSMYLVLHSKTRDSGDNEKVL